MPVTVPVTNPPFDVTAAAAAAVMANGSGGGGGDHLSPHLQLPSPHNSVATSPRPGSSNGYVCIYSSIL